MSMNTNIRVRFAPSPTGYLHVGGLRTALYNYLFAKHNGGKFILRIEDTDQSRMVEGALENLIRTLKWAGLDYDEGPDREGNCGPYIQSQRLPIYREHALDLIKKGNAYYCFCTPERLDEVRKKQTELKQSFSYDRHCREIPLEETERRIATGEKYVVRMKVPLTGEITFEDAIRGKVTITYKVLDDQVILKSDGFPTYHLAVVVDDHLMGITHVIRGEEWLPSAPKHLLLYRFFGWEAPVFAHLPLLLNPDKSKLSKRQGDVAVEDYRSKGYLKEAIVNFVAFLGWNPGDEREVFTLDQLIHDFSLERVGKAGAVFNVEKLNWLNQQHIRLLSDETLAEMFRPMLEARGIRISDEAYFLRVIGLLKEKLTFPQDFGEYSIYFFEEPKTYEEEGIRKYWEPETPERLARLSEIFTDAEDFSHTTIETVIKQLADELQIKTSKLIHPARLAVSGKQVGPGLYELMSVLGKETVVRRLQTASKAIKIS
jgi:glutamyl-tRNA synthetase